MERAKLEAEINESIKNCEKQIADLEHQLYVAKQNYVNKIVELSNLKKELIHIHIDMKEQPQEKQQEHHSKIKDVLEKLREAFTNGFQNTGI
jgi:regulator of replication initiation timing